MCPAARSWDPNDYVNEKVKRVERGDAAGIPVDMKQDDWRGVIRLVVVLLAVALATIPAALALGVAVRVFLWAAGLT